MKKIAWLLVIILALTLVPQSTFFSAVGESGTAERLDFTVTLPTDRQSEAFLMTDDCASTFVLFQSDSTVRLDFSEEAAHLVTVWEDDPDSVTLTCYQGDVKLSEAALDVPFLTTVTALPEGTTAVELRLTVPKKGQVGLSEVYAYSAGNLPSAVFQWQRAAHPDVLLVVAYPGDEYRFFGGLLPKLINDGVNVAVLYCDDYGRACLEEDFAALWSLGLKTYPVRLRINTKQSLDYGELWNHWKKTNHM